MIHPVRKFWPIIVILALPILVRCGAQSPTEPPQQGVERVTVAPDSLERTAADVTTDSNQSARTSSNNATKTSNRSLIALVRLYQATFGPEWRDNTNWKSDAPIERWHGISADTLGRVTGVDLSNNRLKGPLSPSLSNLEDLKSLNLSGNPDLVGPLPLSFVQLSLESLNLEGTQLCARADTGFQEWVDSVSSVEGVRTCADDFHPDWEALATVFAELGGHYWKDNTNWLSKAPLEYWYGVSTIRHEDYFKYHDVNYPGPDDWDGISTIGTARVTMIDMQENNLEGHIPAELGQLEELRSLSLPYNSISGKIPPELGRLTKLEYLNLSHNIYLSGMIPVELGQLVNLKYLSFFYNNLSGPIHSELGNLRKLRILNLHYNWLTGQIPPELGQLKNLEKLDLTRNYLTGPIPPELGQMKSLETLFFYNNGLTGPIPPELSQLTRLERLGLANNSLSGAIPPELGQLTSLFELDLSSNSLSGAIPPELGQLRALETLNFNEGGNLTGPIPSEFGQLICFDLCQPSSGRGDTDVIFAWFVARDQKGRYGDG